MKNLWCVFGGNIQRKVKQRECRVQENAECNKMQSAECRVQNERYHHTPENKREQQAAHFTSIRVILSGAQRCYSGRAV